MLFGPMSFAPLLLVAFTLAASTALQEREPDPGRVVARAGGAELLESQLEPVLLDRFALGEDGREQLKVLLSAKLIPKIAKQRGVAITDAELDRRFDELDREVRAAGHKGGLLATLEEQDLALDEFRRVLRVQMMQERLTRLDKDINQLLPVSAHFQESWLAEQFEKHGVTWGMPPWEDGLAANTSVGIHVTLDEYADTLRRRLPRVEVEETAWHLILLDGIEKRLVDLAPEARERAIDAEIERRRRVNAALTPGITFEQRLGASGRTVEGLRRDPSVEIAALARVWVDRKYGEAGLRAAYEADREDYDGLFGAAVRANLLFLVASKTVNEFNPRTFAEAEQQLERMLESIGNTDDFRAVAARNSEEPTTRTSGGELGWVTRLDPRVPVEFRRLLFGYLDAGGTVPPEGVAVGPERFDTGAAVLWISATRPTPDWDVMVEHVHNRLRATFLEGIAKRDEVVLVP